MVPVLTGRGRVCPGTGPADGPRHPQRAVGGEAVDQGLPALLFLNRDGYEVSVVEFERGAAREFGLAIGADGVHSKVR